MPILVENIIEKSAAVKIGDGNLRRLNEAIESEMVDYRRQVESDMNAKFNGMVEAVGTKFDEQVNRAIMESVADSSLGREVNTKMAETISGMIGILEASGLYTSEKAKDLNSMLKESNRKLEDAYKEREAIRSQLDDSKKENLIMQRLMGMKPEIVSAALEYFKNKDILDVTDEIDSFVDGDFSKLVHDDSSNYADGLSDVTLDNISDALKDIDSERNIEYAKKGGAKLEALGRGLKPQRAATQGRDPGILVENDEGAEDDISTALSQIEGMRGLGFNFLNKN